MANAESGKVLGDLVKMEMPQNYCRKLIKIDKSVATKIGTPLDRNGSNGVGSLVANGSEANCDAIALEVHAANAAAQDTILAMVRGPAIIDGAQLEKEANVTIAELTTPLEAIGILVASEPSILSEGV